MCRIIDYQPLKFGVLYIAGNKLNIWGSNFVLRSLLQLTRLTQYPLFNTCSFITKDNEQVWFIESQTRRNVLWDSKGKLSNTKPS